MSPGQTPRARLAHQAVGFAIKSGELRKQPCEVCGVIGVAHHDDYTKPLDVRWLCARHHRQLHASIKRATANEVLAAHAEVRAEKERRLVNVFITRQELAKRHKTTVETIKRRQAKGIYTAHKIGRSVLYKLSDIVTLEGGIQ